MMKNLRQSKGITLIALVITIIVLLILAGVAISMLAGENGLINKTNSAKAENETTTVEEQVKLTVMAALAAGNGKIEGADAFTALNDGLKEAGYSGTIDEATVLWPVTVTIGDTSLIISRNGAVSELTEKEEIPKIEAGVVANEKSKYVDVNNDVAIIPKGFKVSSIETEKIIDDGMVVIAPDESEFVWVPVEDINSMVMCQAHTGASDCSIVKGGDGKLKCENHTTDSKPICGKLYTTDLGENFDTALDTQKYDAVSGLREPAVLTSTNSGDASTQKGKGLDLLSSIVGIDNMDDWQKQLQDEYEEMAKSVYENKGFYIGRYETSLDENFKVQSKANKPSATGETTINNKALTWYGLYQIEKEYNKKEYEEGITLESIVGSTMIWGSQYDQMMLWMKANDIDVTSINLNGVEKNINSTTTGTDGDKDKINNVYDLLGCKNEWTLEASNTYGRIYRGGNYNVSRSPSYIAEINAYNVVSVTSRLTLYIK